MRKKAAKIARVQNDKRSILQCVQHNAEAFLSASVTLGEVKDYVRVKELYAVLKKQHAVLEADQSSIGLQLFKAICQERMQNAYKVSYGFRDKDGKCRTLTSAIWGYRRA